MSSAAAKWIVPRCVHDRTMSPASMVARTAATDGCRSRRATDASAPGRAWAWTHARRRTTSAGSSDDEPISPRESSRAAETCVIFTSSA